MNLFKARQTRIGLVVCPLSRPRKPGYYIPASKLILHFGIIIRGTHIVPLESEMLPDRFLGG